MDKAVISDQLLELIAVRKVVAAVFTTYTFEPDFFELEVIPLLLKQSIPYSTDDRVKRFQARENHREANLPIEVFYDALIFLQSGESTPEMEYLCHGVNLGNRAFHGKVNLLLVEDEESEEGALLVGAGSNNLSRAGWWDNIECQHWEEIRSGISSRKFINVLQEEVEFLVTKRAFKLPSASTALDRISDFLATCKGSNSADAVYYYGLSSPDYRKRFIEFLQMRQSPLKQYNNWRLEIISPYFADDANNQEHDVFRQMGIDEISLLLPMDEEGNALCQGDYYSHVQSQDHLAWARWRENIGRSLGLTADYYRRLHAKVFHFFNKKQSWIFVGSVNFTHKALYENVEAGFLVKLDRAGPLLEPIPEHDVVDQFADLSEQVPGAESDRMDDIEYPQLYLRYDWVSKTLSGRTAPRKSYEIQIIGPEGRSVMDTWTLDRQETAYKGDTAELQDVLRNGSLVKVIGNDLKQKHSFPECTVMLQQIGWSHKPLVLPDLTPEQILAIYADMDPERRQLMLLNAKIRELVLSVQGGELIAHQDEALIDQFFCEYAEIFNAFSKLKQKLVTALETEQTSQLDYYLTGAGVDSLPILFAQASEDSDGNMMGGVTAYLLLLCMLEIYNDDQFIERPNVIEITHDVIDALNALKASDRLAFKDNSKKGRQKFFSWFEEEFSKSYSAIEEMELG